MVIIERVERAALPPGHDWLWVQPPVPPGQRAVHRLLMADDCDRIVLSDAVTDRLWQQVLEAS